MTFPHPDQEAFESKPVPFCKNQIQTKESGDWFDCMEHMGEGRIFECRYKTSVEAKKCEYFKEQK